MSMTMEHRDFLLGRAQRIADDLDAQACKQAAVALSILRTFGPDALQTALRLDIPAGGSAAHWLTFRKRAAGELAMLLDEGVDDAAFVLGWVKRLGFVKVPQRVKPKHPRGRR